MDKKANYEIDKINPNKQIDINNVILSEFEFLETIGVGKNLVFLINPKVLMLK